MGAVTVHVDEGVAQVTLDDGKANVMSAATMAELDAALDEVEAAEAVLLLTGRPGLFSAGYDRAMFGRSPREIVETIHQGGELVLRLLGFPHPVVVACTGHAVAQGAFVLMTADSALGAAGEHRIGLNEVAIGLTIPWYGIETARARLAPATFHHATTTAAFFTPEEAARAGFLDRVVPADRLADEAATEAVRLRDLDRTAHRGTKLRVRRDLLETVRTRHDEERATALAALGDQGGDQGGT